MIYEIAKILNIDEEHEMIIVGAGHLGQALANYTNFRKRGFIVKAIFDQDPTVIGTRVGDIPEHLDVDRAEAAEAGAEALRNRFLTCKITGKHGISSRCLPALMLRKNTSLRACSPGTFDTADFQDVGADTDHHLMPLSPLLSVRRFHPYGS